MDKLDLALKALKKADWDTKNSLIVCEYCKTGTEKSGQLHYEQDVEDAIRDIQGHYTLVKRGDYLDKKGCAVG